MHIHFGLIAPLFELAVRYAEHLHVQTKPEEMLIGGDAAIREALHTLRQAPATQPLDRRRHRLALTAPAPAQYRNTLDVKVRRTTVITHCFSHW